MAGGGGWGEGSRHARAKDRGRTRRPARQSRATQKSFLFLLEEKIWRAQIGKSKENFFVGRAGFRHGGGAASLVPFKVGSSKVQNIPPELTGTRGRENEKSSMKTVGIIGGLGPETTSEFYLELIFSTQKLNKANRPKILIYSVPLPYDIEEDAIARGKGEERCLPFLIDAAKSLERAGADFLVMPCNSLHAFIENIRGSVKIPVLSIVEEATKFLKEERISEVGIISTLITLNKKLYETSFTTNGIRQVVPDDFQQAKIGKMIHNLVSNRHDNKDREELVKIISEFEGKGVGGVILACTDLQLLIPEHPRLKIYDTMKILVDTTVKELLGEE